MPAIAALLTLFILAVAFGVFLLLWIIVLRWFRVKRRLLLGLASLPVFVILLIAFWNYTTRPSALFSQSFGFAPSPSVKFCNSSYWYLGDSGHTYLHFVADDATVSRIVARGLSPVSKPLSGSEVSFCNADPEWWELASGNSDRDVYLGRFPHRDFAREEEVLIYDRATGEVFFRFIGID